MNIIDALMFVYSQQIMVYLVDFINLDSALGCSSIELNNNINTKIITYYTYMNIFLPISVRHFSVTFLNIGTFKN